MQLLKKTAIWHPLPWESNNKFTNTTTTAARIITWLDQEKFYLQTVNQNPAAAAAKSLQHVRLCATPQTLCSPPGSPVPGFSRQEHGSGLPFPSPAHGCVLCRFSRVRLCATPETAAYQAPPSMGPQARTLEWVTISFSHQNPLCC